MSEFRVVPPEHAYQGWQPKPSGKPRKPAEPKLKGYNIKGNIAYICKRYFGWEDLQDFHLEALEAMFEGGYIVINWPTDHAKSTMGTFLFPLLSLMEDPNESHIICGANINDSKRRVQALQREIETNKALVADFPHLARPTAKDLRIWSATQFNVSGRTINKPNPSVLASAVGSNDLKGRRGKLVMDDIEGEDARWSPVKREQLYSWLKLEAWRCFEDKRESSRPLLCLMGTPFDVDSIYFKVELEDWKVFRREAYRSMGPGVNVMGEYWAGGQTYLWPAKAEKVERAQRRLNKLQFSVAYLMDPTGGDPGKMSMAQIMRSLERAPFEAEDSLTLASLDPAVGGIGGRANRDADYAGIAVTRINWARGEELPQVEVLEAHAFTGGLFEQVHFMADLSSRYGCSVIYEFNAQQGGNYRQAFQHLHPEVKILRHYTTASNKYGLKTGMGITVLKTLISREKLKVPVDQLESEGVRQLAVEMRDLAPPFKQHNHISAAVWFTVLYCFQRVRHYSAAPVTLTYGQNPMNMEMYRDDPNQPPLERAYRAIGYDRTARSGNPMILGYTAWRRQREMPWEKAIRDEEERFQAALTRRRTG